jgi:Ice-binding-like
MRIMEKMGLWLVMFVLVTATIATLGFYAAAPAQAASPATVNLGSAGDFVILAKTGISTTGTTKITGDIGVSPAAASYITGFGLKMDSSNQFSTSSRVTGHVFAADYTPPTPAKMTTAINDMQTAYNSAAGRTNPTSTGLGAGDITSKTIEPGLYKWGTGVLISAAGVTLSGNATGVWIFQIAQTLVLANGAHVTLSGGALASNIFWQVGGQTTLGTTSVMKGIILCKTAIVLKTGASLEGKALAQTAVTLDASHVNTAGGSSGGGPSSIGELSTIQEVAVAAVAVAGIAALLLGRSVMRKK